MRFMNDDCQVRMRSYVAEHGNGGIGDEFSESWDKPELSAEAHRAIAAHDIRVPFLRRRQQ